MTHITNKRLTYNLIRRGAASHPALQLALGVLDSMLRGICCDDRWAWCEEERKAERAEKWKKKRKVYFEILTDTKLSDINFDDTYSTDQSKHYKLPGIL